MEKDYDNNLSVEGSTKLKKIKRRGGGISPNEIFGYSSAVMFFVFAFVIYFNILLPGQFQEYRAILVAILALYGLLRFLITRSKAHARRRKEKIEQHRDELERNANQSSAKEQE